MNFQPFKQINKGFNIEGDFDNSELSKCGASNLTIFDKDFIPNFYIKEDLELSDGTFFYILKDRDGNVVSVQSITDLEYTKVPTSEGTYYYFNEIPSTSGIEGTYQPCIGYDTDPGEIRMVVIFDFFKFVDNTENCFYQVSFSNNCNIDNISFERVPDFEFKFLVHKDSGFGRLTPVFEPELEVNTEGEDIATYKRMFLQESFRLFHPSECLINSIFYASIFDNFQIEIPGEDRQKVFRLEFATPIYDGETCCPWYLDINLVREYRTNSGCCDDITYTDCIEFDFTSVTSAENYGEQVNIETTNPNTTNCYLIVDVFQADQNEWANHINEVTCGDGMGGWTYSTPSIIYVESQDRWYEYNGTSYDSLFTFTATFTGANFPPTINTYDLVGNVPEGYEVCLFVGYNGSSEFELLNTYTSSEFNSGVSIGVPTGQNNIIKAVYKLGGCNEVEFILPNPI